MMTLFTSPGLEDLWQIHFSLLSGQEYTVPGMFIANLTDEPPTAMPVHRSPRRSGPARRRRPRTTAPPTGSSSRRRKTARSPSPISATISAKPTFRADIASGAISSPACGGGGRRAAEGAASHRASTPHNSPQTPSAPRSRSRKYSNSARCSRRSIGPFSGNRCISPVSHHANRSAFHTPRERARGIAVQPALRLRRDRTAPAPPTASPHRTPRGSFPWPPSAARCARHRPAGTAARTASARRRSSSAARCSSRTKRRA